MLTYRRGDRGPAVVEIRAILAHLGHFTERGQAEPDMVYSASVERAVCGFQQDRGLTVTGEVNRETWRELDASRWQLGSRVLSFARPEPLLGDDVRQLQERLLEMGYNAGRADGTYGPVTATALSRFQREVGLVPDGSCGPYTIAALGRLGRKVVGGRPTLLRESARFRAGGTALADKRIVIDPGHGGPDGGVTVMEGRAPWREADLAYDLAARLEGRLAAAGMRVLLTRGPAPASPLSDRERATLANELGADLLISIHLDGHTNPAASGVATYHFGRYGDSAVTSTVGERLAHLVQREIVVRTGLRDCRTHAKTWELLRLTQMPAVLVEAGYLTSTQDRTRLVDPLFRDRLVEAVMAAVRRMYLPIEADVATGSIDVSELRAEQRLFAAATASASASASAGPCRDAPASASSGLSPRPA